MNNNEQVNNNSSAEAAGESLVRAVSIQLNGCIFLAGLVGNLLVVISVERYLSVAVVGLCRCCPSTCCCCPSIQSAYVVAGLVVLLNAVVYAPIAIAQISFTYASAQAVQECRFKGIYRYNTQMIRLILPFILLFFFKSNF